MAEAEIPSTPTIRISLLRLVPTRFSPFLFHQYSRGVLPAQEGGKKSRAGRCRPSMKFQRGLSYLEALTARMASMSMGVTL